MLKTEKILNSYGLTFGEAEELLQIDVLTSLMQAKDKGGDQLALQVATLDERVAEYLNSSAIKTILEENRKEAIGQDEDELDIDLSDFDLDLDDLDSASGFDVRVTDFEDIEIDLEDLDDAETDDEGDEETSSPPPPMVTTPKPSPKEKGMANAIVFENVPATNFFSQIVKNKVPEVDSDGALVVKFGDLRVRALLEETFVRLGAMPLNSADFRVEVVSMDAEKVVEYNQLFGEGQAQKMEKGVLSLATEEVSQVFNTQQYLVGGAEINTSFDGITTILKKANLKDEYDLGLLDFPLGKAVHPLMVWRSNYFIEPKTLYALANCDEFFSASVGGYRYITNYCEANDLKQLRIFEIGGPHLNVPFSDTRGETITNSVIQDDFSVFSGRVGGIIGDTYSRNEVLYEVGFTQVLPKDIQYEKVDSLSERAGYFVFGSHNSARTFYIPAVVYNYFKKFYGVKEVLAGMKPNSGLFTLYFRKGFDIQGFIMIDESNAPSSAPARLLPTDAVEYMEEIVGMNAVAFTDKINIEEDESVTFLGEVRSRPEDGLQRVFEEQIALFEQALEFMDEGEDDAEIATLKEAIEGARIMLEDDIDEQAEEEILESIEMIPEEEDELGQVAVANDQDILPTPSADDPVVEEIIEQEKEDVLDEEDDMDIVFIDKMPDLPEGEEILVNPEPTFDDDDLDDDDDIEINEIDLDFAKGGKTGKYTIHLSKDLGLDDEFRYHVVGPDGGVIGCQSKKECQEVISLAKRGMIEMEKGGKTTTQGFHKFTLPAKMVAEFGLGGSEIKRDIYHDRANDRFYMYDFDGDLEEILNYYPIQKLRGLVDLMTEEGIKGYAKGGAVSPRKTSIKKIMDGVRGSNGGPFTIIAFKDGKLLAQRSRRYPEEIPLVVEAIRKLFQNAKIEVEDGGGQIIYQSTPTRERSFAKGGKVGGDELVRKYNEVTQQGGYMNCELFCIMMKDGKSFKEFDKLKFEGVDKLQEGDVLQFGMEDNPRHYAIYLKGDKVLEVEEWGASPREYTLTDNLNMYEEISAVYREPDSQLAKGGRTNPTKHIKVYYTEDNGYGHLESEEVIESSKNVEEVREKWKLIMSGNPDIQGYQIVEVKADGSERKVPSKFHGFAKGGKTNDVPPLSDEQEKLFEHLKNRAPQFRRIYKELRKFNTKNPKASYQEILEFLHEKMSSMEGDFQTNLTELYIISEADKRIQEEEESSNLARGGKTMDDKVSDKIRLLLKEGKPQDQAVAIALSMRDEGKLADGGLLDKEFKFDKNFVIYVPSTSNVGDVISMEEMQERVGEVEELVANEFGGFTKTETDGGYKASSGDIVEEDIVKVSVFSTDEAWEKNEKRLIRAIKIWAKEWGQEAIGFEYEGDLYYIDAKGKMAKGGKTMTPSDIVSLLTDEEVAKELVDKMFETLESVDFDVDEKTALTQAKDNIEHSRKMLIEILEHQA